MKTLFILRHAKSSWENSKLADFDRPLNGRGQKAAPLMGELIRKNQFEINLIVSSPAERAKQTAELVKKAARLDAEIEYDEKIYEASPQRLLEIISASDDKFDSVMLVGHNPGLEGLLKLLTGELEAMPTAALAVVDLETNSWSKINSSSGTLRILIRPKDKEVKK